MTETLIEKYGLQKHISEPDRGRQLTIDRLVEILNETLPIERLAMDKLSPFPVIDTEFLSMKASYPLKISGVQNFKISLPCFAFYSLDSYRCKIDVNLKSFHGDVEEFSCRLLEPIRHPKVLADQLCHAIDYKDFVYDSYRGNPWNFSVHHITSDFKGLIPQETRKMLKQAVRIFDGDVYIIGEADWKAELIETKDPLIVGVRDETCYLIDAFDCTPMEEYVRREFKK